MSFRGFPLPLGQKGEAHTRKIPEAAVVEVEVAVRLAVAAADHPGTATDSVVQATAAVAAADPAGIGAADGTEIYDYVLTTFDNLPNAYDSMNDLRTYENPKIGLTYDL